MGQNALAPVEMVVVDPNDVDIDADASPGRDPDDVEVDADTSLGHESSESDGAGFGRSFRLGHETEEEDSIVMARLCAR